MNENVGYNLNLKEAPLSNIRKSVMRSTVYSNSLSFKIDINKPYDNSPLFKKEKMKNHLNDD